ncbi:hypothetical protein GCM10020001_075310 [Nonomuraea salmonea]
MARVVSPRSSHHADSTATTTWASSIPTLALRPPPVVGAERGGVRGVRGMEGWWGGGEEILYGVGGWW